MNKRLNVTYPEVSAMLEERVSYYFCRIIIRDIV